MPERRGRPDWRPGRIKRHLREICTLLTALFRSGPGILACSLTAGLLLGGSALIYLESLDERGESSYPSAASQESIEKSGGDAGAKARTTPNSRPDQTKPEQTKARGESKVSRERENGSGTRALDSRQLETEVRGIVANHTGNYGVVLWQPESGTRISLDAGKRFRSASLAKLPVLLALYREAAEGRLSLDERIEMSESDIQPGTGTLQYRPPGTTLTLRKYAEYLIKESDNTAWNILEDRLGKKRIRAELARAGAESTSYEYARHTTTPDDTLKVLQKISDPGYTSPSLSQEMLKAMTGTAFEERLPQGLPADARIHHKIGSLGDNFGDAGLVMPPEGKEYGGPYYVVVLSRNAGGEANARRAMREISLTAYQGLVDPEARPRSPIPRSGSERRQQ